VSGRAAPRGSLLAGVALAVAALAAIPSAGQEPSVDVRLQPERFGVEDLARLSVTVVGGDGRVAAPELGPLSNLEVVSGPSTENHFSWVNGVATSSVRFTYLLQPAEVGPASVGAVTVRIGDTTVVSKPISTEVVAGSLAPPRRGRQVPPMARDPFADLFDPFGESFGRREVTEASLTLRQLVSGREVAVGEPIVATVVLDTTVTGIEGFEWVTPPAYPGWWAQRVDLPEQISPEVVERDGTRMHRYVVARHVLVPLKTGAVEIPAVKARVGIRARSVFAPLQVVERGSAETRVTVRDRPSAPPGFAGAVGDLRYSASVDPGRIAFGESAVVSIELEGRGNLPLVEPPPVWPTCADCETYPPEEESAFEVKGSGIQGRRLWRTTLVPRTWGSLDLGTVTLAVFDPSSGSYRSQVLGPLKLEVSAPEPTPTPVVVAGAAPAEPLPGERTGTLPEAGGAARPPWLWLVVGLAAGSVAGILLTFMVVRRRGAAVPRRRGRQRPAERARELQAALESWWHTRRDNGSTDELKADMEALRRDLETVRFAPGRADHSETIADLEERLRSLMRRA